MAGEQMNAAAVIGYDGEYLGSREYTPGMPVRRWDYNSWARLGQPVVREYNHPEQPAAAIVLDNWFGGGAAADGVQESSQFEATLSLAAALSEALVARNYRMVLLATASETYDLSGCSAADVHTAVLRLLAVQMPAKDGSFDKIRTELGFLPASAAFVFVLLNRWDADCQTLCRRILDRGCELTRVFLDGRAAEQPERGAHDVVASVAQVERGGVVIQ